MPLLVSTALALSNAVRKVVANMRCAAAQMEQEGVDATRVDLLPLTAGAREHLTTYNDMDISLDPFPYTGTTTTAESLLMGVPVVTQTGAAALSWSPCRSLHI